METIDDFKGFKLRVPNLEVYLKTWQWLNTSPTPLAMNEVYTALQQNTVEGQENPFADSLNYSFDEVCKYWIKTNHVYSCNLFMMDRTYFNSLPEEIQNAVIEAAEYAGQEISAVQKQRDQEDGAESSRVRAVRSSKWIQKRLQITLIPLQRQTSPTWRIGWAASRQWIRLIRSFHVAGIGLYPLGRRSRPLPQLEMDTKSPASVGLFVLSLSCDRRQKKK